MKNKLPKVIFVIGPTASGKTSLGISLAKKYNGEIINADSRQVYKEMDIATDKPMRGKDGTKKSEYIVEGVIHHLLDIVKPNKEFTLANFKEDAVRIINDMTKRGKLPIVVGGTGLYVWSLVDNLELPKVAPNPKLRKSFDKKSLPQLTKLLKQIDPVAFEKIDLKNKRRVLRSLEVAITTGKSIVELGSQSEPMYDCLQIGLHWTKEELYERINERVDNQIKRGLLEEVKKLSAKYPWHLPSMSSIGYKQMGYYLRGEKTLEEAVELLKKDTRHYAKRQLTWFKRDERIYWIAKNSLDATYELVDNFLAK